MATHSPPPAALVAPRRRDKDLPTYADVFASSSPSNGVAVAASPPDRAASPPPSPSVWATGRACVPASEVVEVPYYPEICYATNEYGDFVMIEDMAWNTFLAANAVQPLLPRLQRCTFPEVLGRSLFEYISDPKLQRFTRHILHMVATGAQPRLTYHYFCDSDTIERKMAMSVSRLCTLDGHVTVLWASKILHERVLPVPATYLAAPPTTMPPVGLYPDELLPLPPSSAMDNDNLDGDPMDTTTEPCTVLPCCSYCKRIMMYLANLTVTPELLASLLAEPPTEDDAPEYESNGLVPIFGRRGKRGVHRNNPFMRGSCASTHIWLTPEQFALTGTSLDGAQLYHGVCDVCYHEIARFFNLDAEPIAVY